jgi:hypothetical protein
MMRAAAWMVALAAVAPEGPAAAQGIASPTVVVLRPPSTEGVAAEATARVQGELGAAGFHVVVLPVAGRATRTDLETAGGDIAPVGAFAIFVHPEGAVQVAEIWVSDRMRSRTIVESAHLTDADRGRASEVLAVRAVELLRASLAELWLQPPPAPTVPAAPPAPETRSTASIERAPAVAARPAFGAGLGLGAGVGAMAGVAAHEAGPILLPSLYVVYGNDSGGSLQLALRGLGPAVTLSAAAGTAKVEEQLASLDVVKTWWPRWRIVPFVGAGAGLQHVRVTGSGVAPYEGSTADDFSFVTSAGVGAAFPVYSGLSLVAQSRAVVAWPPTAVRIGGVDAGHFGEPSLLVDAAVLGVFP